MTRLRVCIGLLCVTLSFAAVPARAQPPSFLTFESGHVRPLGLSPSGARLFAVNTPDGRLEIFDVTGPQPRAVASVPVGMEPVTVAVRSQSEVWVVNHLSDSVSIVDVGSSPPRVVRTLLVGDEPRDLVFAGPGRGRAFITTAHRGQHRTHPSLSQVPGAGDPRLTTPGVGRADVWVFDATAPGPGLGGTPLAIVELFGDTPRALATSPDGDTVYAAVFQSGNQTTVLSTGVVCPGFEPTDESDACPDFFPGVPGGNPGPATNFQGKPAPHVGLIVRYDPASGEWLDELRRDWSAALRFHLPDLDVFAIDAETLAPGSTYAHVGTTLFNMVTNPATGVVYVSNTEARNEVRFEGPGTFGGSTVQGHLAEARITVLRGDEVLPRHLNRHIDYSQRPAAPETRRHSLATPVDMAVSRDGTTLYVAAFGSGKVGVFPTQALEAGSFDPTAASASSLTVSGGGPSGLALDEPRQRLYVFTRFDNSISVLDLETGAETAHVALHNPEPPQVVHGRPVLYDAVATSSNGEASCASCHVFGDLDGLAWDLGDPDAEVTRSALPIEFEDFTDLFPGPINGTNDPRDFHPMKGPMTTQTLRGLATSGAMHWRGDRSTGFFGDDPFDPRFSFMNFVVAFEGLLGRAEPISTADMERFADFTLELTLPPNPNRALDNSLTPRQRRGMDFFDGPRRSDGGPAPFPGNTCEDCHGLDRSRGHFGTNTEASFEGESQIFKIPHLRNAYQKVGMFGRPATGGVSPGDNGHKGDQVRGFGFAHDGSFDTLLRFFNATVFESNFNDQVGFRNDGERRDMEEAILAFETDLAPVVGQQITLDPTNGATVASRIGLLKARAEAPFVSKVLGGETTECDLVVHGNVAGQPRAWLYDTATGRFRGDLRGEVLGDEELRGLAAAPGQELTFTCVPPGSGFRVALDRDLDGTWNRDELNAGTDPADPQSRPSCDAGPQTLCLNQGRFQVIMSFLTPQGQGGRGGASPLTDETGTFWFFQPTNVEAVVKVLDGCANNGRYWVFAAGLTNVEVELVVTDTDSGEARTYKNPQGEPFQPIQDTAAFATCESTP